MPSRGEPLSAFIQRKKLRRGWQYNPVYLSAPGSNFTNVQEQARQEGTLVEPQSIGQLAIGLGLNKWNYTDGPQQWTNWQTPGVDVNLPILGKKRIDVKGLADVAASTVLDPITYMPAGIAAKGAVKGAQAAGVAAKKVAPEVGEALQAIAEQGSRSLRPTALGPSPSAEAGLASLTAQVIPTKRGMFKLSTSRGGQTQTFNIQGTFVGDKYFVSRDPSDLIYGQTERNYGISDVRTGQGVYPGKGIYFDKASEAIERAKQLSTMSDDEVRALDIRKLPPSPGPEGITVPAAVHPQEAGLAKRPIPPENVAGTVEPPTAPPAQVGTGGKPPEPPKPPTTMAPVPPEPDAFGIENKVAQLRQKIAVQSPVDKLTNLVTLAKPVRGKTEALKHRELQRRAAMVGQALEQGTGEQAFITAKQSMKGKLPAAAFEPPRPSFTQADITGLYDKVRTADLPVFTRISAETALTKTLGGELPTRGEISLLEEIFGPKLAEALLKRRPMGQKAWETFLDVISVPKSLAAAFDVSGMARQGILLSSEPTFWKSVGPGLKSFAKEEVAQAVHESIVNNPLYNRMRSAGLYLAPYGQVTARLSAREEAFMSKWAQKIPWVKWSNRSYVTFLNKLRADTFSRYVNKWIDSGMPEETLIPKTQQLADFLNKASGRGSLGALGRGDSAAVMNALFFAPKYMVSRFQAPLHIFNADPAIRKIAIKNMVGFVGAGLSVLGIMKLAGASIETDPRSTDFGRGRIGNTRIDFWGGYQPIARYISQFITGQYKSSSGQIEKRVRYDTFMRFVQSKLGPGSSLFTDITKAQDYSGIKLGWNWQSVGYEGWNRLVPLFVQDMTDAVKQEGLTGVPLALPSAVGGSVLSYPPSFNAWMSKYPELSRLNLPYGAVGNTIQNRVLTAEQQADYQNRVNQYAEQGIAEQLAKPTYKNLTDEQKTKLLGIVIDMARKRAAVEIAAGAEKVNPSVMPVGNLRSRMLKQPVGVK